MKPLSYYIDNSQTRELTKFAGERFEKFTHENLWDLITVLSGELALAPPKDGQDVGLVRMIETKQKLKLSWDAVVEHALEVLDGISRQGAKCLLAGLTDIALHSDIL